MSQSKQKCNNKEPSEEVFHCERCGKDFPIADDVGFRNYVEIPNGKDMCRECFKQYIYKNGSDTDWFVGGDLVATFYDKTEIETNGFVFLDEYLVDSEKKLEKLCDELAYISDYNDEKVLVRYVSFSKDMSKAVIEVYTK